MASVSKELNDVSLEYWQESASIVPKQTLVNTEYLCNTAKDFHNNLTNNLIKIIPNQDFNILKYLCLDT